MKDTSSKIYKPVGSLKHGGINRPRCVSTIRDLLQRVPKDKGGQEGGFINHDADSLVTAINEFQEKQFDGKSNGVIRPGQLTLERLNKLARPILETNCLKLPGGRGWSQGDRRWYLVNMHWSNSLPYTIWYKGCVLAAVATALYAKKIRIPNPARVKEIVEKKLRKAKRHEALKGKMRALGGIDFGTVSPLTLDAWMSSGTQRGYKHSKVNIDLVWKDVANISPLISHEYRTKHWDKNYPSPVQLRHLLDDGYLIVAYEPPHHFVLLTGYKGENLFTKWDVGYVNKTVVHYRKFESLRVFKYNIAGRGPVIAR